MEIQEKENNEYYTIDLVQIVKALWKKAWLIALCGILAALAGFIISSYVIHPKYSSSVKLYVNNSSISLGSTSFSITSSELSAAQSLVKTYGDILDSSDTLDTIINASGVDYTWKELSEMITYEPSNDTEIMLVTVTGEDPEETKLIANTIIDVLNNRISEIINGASMEVVNQARTGVKVSPSITKFTAVGLILGILISCAGIVIIALMDDRIHDEDYVLKNYDFPVLGKVPDLINPGNKSYAYKSKG